MKMKQIGNMETTGKWKNRQTGRVYETSGVCPALSTMQGGGQEPKILCLNTKDENGEQPHYQDRVYNTNGISTAITAGFADLSILEEKKMEEVIVASRGRNKENPSDRTPGNDVEQRLEINSQGISNTLTTVQKDNMVLGKARQTTERETGERKTRYRIRKLTPRECGRLMGVSEKYIDRMEKVNCNSQLYKGFGNSIVVDVLEAIFRQLKEESK